MGHHVVQRDVGCIDHFVFTYAHAVCSVPKLNIRHIVAHIKL